MECKIILLDEVNCLIHGLSTNHLSYFWEKYGIFAKGYFFNPKFELGLWDGKIRFFHKSGKTFINLLPDLLPRIVNLKYKVEIEDRRKSLPITPDLIDQDFFSNVNVPDSDKPWKFRDYQVDMVNALLKNSGGVGVAGTGSGKTSVCAAIAHSYETKAKYRSIIIVPDTTLTDQTKEKYAHFNLDVGEYTGTLKDLNHQHVVSTWQTLKNTPSILQEFNVIIVDECQGLRGPILNELLIKHGKNIPLRFGVTGTLPKEPADAMSVKTAVGQVQYEIPAHILIEKGHLSNLHIDIFQLEVNLKKEYQHFLKDIENEPNMKKITYTKFKNSYFPDFTSEKAFLQSEPARIKWVVQYIKSKTLTEKGNVFCLVNGIPYGKKLAKEIPGAVFLHGKDHKKVRKEIYELFKTNNDLIVIATVNIAGVGLDIPRIFNLIFIDIGQSFIRVIQAIGRGLRKADDKDFVNITDICSDLKYNKRHLIKRLNYYDEAKYPWKKHTVDY